MSAYSLEEQEKVAAVPFTLIHGDCITEMSKMPAGSVDAVVTDPPYGIRFMGKAWDGADIEARAERRRSFDSHAPDSGPNGGHKSLAAEAGKYDLAPAAMRAFQQFSEEWAREAFRVLKPGGHLLSFASTRTYHRMVSGIEDAGFEIRDRILFVNGDAQEEHFPVWVFGSGFPKSRNWTMEKAAKGEGESVAMTAAGFDGWGTALKPAHEPICIARKPFDGTVAENMLQNGTGALNIDGCRIRTDESLRAGAGTTWDAMHRHEGRASRDGEASVDRRYTESGATNFAAAPGPRGGDARGRWPANLIHDGSDEVAALFPQAAGQQAAVRGSEPSAKTANVFGEFAGRTPAVPRGDTGSAARFFYCAKASRADRNEGCDSLPDQKAGMNSNTSGQHITRRDGWAPSPVKNNHPTVKPTDLMAYLCRLVTPPGGVVLDPFMGSGSTGKAAMRESFRFIGIELEADYLAIARARIEYEVGAVARRQAEIIEQQRIAAQQKTIFELDGVSSSDQENAS